MKKIGHSRRLLSVLLALVMLLSLLPTAVFAADPAPKATKITDASELKAGDQIILTATANSKTYAAGSLSSKYLTSIETDPTDPADKVEIFTLGGEAGAWTLTASDGKQLYTNAANALNNTGSGTGTWTIAIDANGLATVASTNSACGRILYNVNSPRFLNYTSATNVSMLLPSIYKLAGAAEPGDPTPSEPIPGLVPISTALAGENGKDFTVQGVVTLVDGQNIYLQDATGGICLRLGSKTSEIALGDTIYGTGKRAEYNKLPQLGSGTFKKSSGLTLTAKATTIGALTDKDVCGYVKLKGLEITKIDDNNGKYTSPNVTLKDADGKTIQLYKAVMEKKDGKWAFAVGDMVDVTAAVSTFNGTLQLRNTLVDEIRAAGTIVDPISDDMIPAGAITVKEAGAITASTSNVSVVGQVVYHYGNAYNNKASINSIIWRMLLTARSTASRFMTTRITPSTRWATS